MSGASAEAAALDDGVPLVRADHVGIDLGRLRVVEAVDLVVEPGAHLALTGRSGSGKSTLLLALAGLLEPTVGTVTWPGLSPERRARRGQIGLVFQAPSLMSELTAAQNVALPLRLRGVPRAEALARVEVALREVNAADLSDALPASLSGGQQQRVAIARVLAGRHRLVLADEPTGALDHAHAHQVAMALRDGVAERGGALVLATHDPELAATLDEQASIDDGLLSRTVRR